ncbi:MAG: flagellar biosynthesis protein FlhA [Desulfobacterales bacterium]|nr:flagellar biosynthesis protein FlhA [Desulfobacterales bacterium]
MDWIKKFFSGLLAESADVVMVLTVIGILLAMVLPIHPVLLDLLLAMNITLAIIILITTIYTETPLDFSIFPSMLLVLTLFRLSLNVASTRLILLNGNQTGGVGSVITSFGNFVVGGNYVVGMIIFVILVLINFMVITKGSGRIAEVAARFALDSMPGKQMAVDADLNAGIIDEDEAKDRRKEIARESEFHGAMDGASKFVKGDAIAGIIITAINICGGFVIGVFQNDMAVMEAASTYTLLTVGDGLVSQIPALIISTAAGLLVSRAGSEEKMGFEFKKLIVGKPMPIYIGSAVIFFMGVVPGLPGPPFILLALALSGSLFWFQRKEKKADDDEVIADLDDEESGPENVENFLALDTMELEVGYGLIPLVDKSQDGSLLGRIRSIRRQFASDFGIVIPPIHIRDNLKLKPPEYRFIVKGVEITRGELMINHFLAMDPGDVVQEIEGIPTTEPAFNLPAIWIAEEKEEDAKFAGYTVVDNSTVLATHITELIKENSPSLLGRQEVQHLLDNLSKTNPKAVEELVPNLLSLGQVQKVLQNLLSERVSVRDLLTVIETLADYAPMSKDPDLLTEYVRQQLGRSIVGQYIQADNSLSVIAIGQKEEEIIAKSLQQTDQGSFLSLDPTTAEALIRSVKDEVGKCMNLNIQPIILCSPGIRRHFRHLIEQHVPAVAVISHAEIIQNVNIKSTGKVSL